VLEKNGYSAKKMTSYTGTVTAPSISDRAYLLSTSPNSCISGKVQMATHYGPLVYAYTFQSTITDYWLNVTRGRNVVNQGMPRRRRRANSSSGPTCECSVA
jgi:hypothetical protein